MRVLFNGRIPAFQAGCVGSIPITRSNKKLHASACNFFVPLAQQDRATAF